MKIVVDFCGEDCKSCFGFECKKPEKSLRLVKKRVTRHYVPPDLTAVKMLEDSKQMDISSLSDAELQAYRQEILSEIKNDIES